MPFPSSPTNGQLANINNISYSYSSASGSWSKTSLGTANVSLFTSNGGTFTGPVTLSSTLTFAAGSVSSPSVTFTGSTTSGLYATGSNGLGIATNGANAIVINSSQNVGIGTTSPGTRLHVLRNDFQTGYSEIAAFVQQVNAGNTSILSFGQVADNQSFIEARDESNNKGFLLLQPYGGSVGIGSVGIGNVGIGNISPAHRLSVNGNIFANSTIAANGTISSTSTIIATGAITSGSTISDSKGDVRAVPQNAQTTAYTLVAADAGRHVSITTGGVTVPANIFATGDSITIYNNSASNQTITQAVNVTLRLVGTASTGNRTLAQRGLATVMCVANNEFVIIGGGVS